MPTESSPKITLRDMLSFIVISAIFAVFPLLIVGRWNWWPGWVYAAIMIFSTIASRGLAARKNPGILAERANSLKAKGVKEWDKKLVPFAAMLGPLLILHLWAGCPLWLVSHPAGLDSVCGAGRIGAGDHPGRLGLR